MVSSRILLFLVGTTIASCHVLRNGKPCKHKHGDDTAVIIGGRITPEDAAYLQPMVSLSPHLSPFAPPPFVQQGTNLYYKPQFVLPAGTILPSPITDVIDKKDCHKHKPETTQLPELPVLEVEHPTFQPIEIPQAPELPPLTMPEPPVFVVPVAPEVQVTEFEPIQIPDAPVLPPFSMPELPVPIAIEIAPEAHTHDETSNQPIAIPEAPILPPFSMPEIPSVIIPVAPELEIPSIPEFKPLEIPEAPALPPLAMPVIPNEVVISATPDIHPGPIEIPQAPVLPAFTMPEIPAVFVPSNPESKPLVIPEAPTLPPLIPCSEIPVSPLAVMPEVIEYQPLPQIPEAPLLPPFTLPEIPTIVVQEPEPIAPVQFVEEIPAPHKDIPPAPVLPPFEMPAIPISPIQLDETPKPVVAIPEAPVLPTFVQSPEVVVYQPIPQIPEAPQLPPFTMPEIPIFVVQEPEAITPPQSVEIVPAPHIEIPSAPVLPPFEMPALPAIVETPAPAPVFKPVEIPPAPELPPLPALPEPVIVDVQNEINEEPCDDDDDALSVRVAPTVYMPEVPFVATAREGVTQPTFWAQNIIIERFLPSVVINDKEELARALKEGSSYPVITKSYFIATPH